MQKIWITLCLMVYSVVAQPLEANREADDGSLAAFDVDPMELHKQYVGLAKAYLMAETLDEARAYTLNGDTEEFAEFFNGKRKTEIGEPETAAKLLTGGLPTIVSRDLNQFGLVDVKWKTGIKAVIFIVWNLDEPAPLVDWKATHEYGEMEWEDLTADTPQTPTEMRLAVSIDNYYNYAFDNEDDWFSLEIVNKSLDQLMFAYLKRDHPEFKKWEKFFKKNKTSYITATLAYPAEAVNKKQVEIISILSDTWHVPE